MAGNKRKKRRKRLTRNSYAIRIVHGTFHEETHDKGERKGQTNEMDHPQDPSFSIDQAIVQNRAVVNAAPISANVHHVIMKKRRKKKIRTTARSAGFFRSADQRFFSPTSTVNFRRATKSIDTVQDDYPDDERSRSYELSDFVDVLRARVESSLVEEEKKTPCVYIRAKERKKKHTHAIQLPHIGK
ncbi:unnamed protein product [Lasius platythorax]|uniref:Uncharacterized protein n=1 Tax=Lasius platythorax TaxID=488582 RepID=A0AAV2NT99_9HYME